MELKPFIKWPGGKTSEIKVIKNYFPKSFDNYFEPFLGGGAVLFHVLPKVKNANVNDISEDLINLNTYIKKNDKNLILNLKKFDKDWKSISDYVEKNKNLLIEIYNLMRLDFKNASNYKIFKSFEKLFNLLNIEINESFKESLHTSIKRKLKRILFIEEKSKKNFEDVSILKNFETIFKAEYYYFIREKYNKNKLDPAIRSAYFYFIREYCYSSMFRFNKQGEFNVPYGGIAYNYKFFDKKAEYLESKYFRKMIKKVNFFNLDFESFLNQFDLTEKDFVFLDPPYDSDFSDYDKNSFTKKDHERLMKWMLNTRAKVVLVIKQTKFIKDLYSKKSFNIFEFDKNYTVSFKNRNDKKVVHLIIRNFSQEE